MDKREFSSILHFDVAQHVGQHIYGRGCAFGEGVRSLPKEIEMASIPIPACSFYSRTGPHSRASKKPCWPKTKLAGISENGLILGTMMATRRKSSLMESGPHAKTTSLYDRGSDAVGIFMSVARTTAWWIEGGNHCFVRVCVRIKVSTCRRVRSICDDARLYLCHQKPCRAARFSEPLLLS